MTKLFGFKLNDTSGIILFIFSLLLMFTALFMVLTLVTNYNNTGTINPAYLILTVLLLGFSGFVLYKTIQQRS